MVLHAASKRPHRFCGLCGKVFNGEDEFDVWYGNRAGGSEDGAIQSTKRCEGLLAIDIVDKICLDNVELSCH